MPRQMNKAEAIKVMMSGKKVTHEYFTHDEWITSNKDGSVYILEDGVEISPAEFWRWRTDDCYNEGWELFENTITAENLKEYGKVEICREIEGKFEIKITTGFKASAMNAFELMGKIDRVIGHKYSVVKKCVVDENLFDYILVPDK